MATVTKVIMDKDDLQPLADGIKELEGNTSNITLSQMENAISSTNSEINRQGTLISEIISALEGKGAPGGGTSGNIETCTVTVSGNAQCEGVLLAYVTEENGQLKVIDATTSFVSGLTFKAVCGTQLTCYFSQPQKVQFDCNGAEVYAIYQTAVAIKITAAANENVSIYAFSSSGGSGD